MISPVVVFFSPTKRRDSRKLFISAALLFAGVIYERAPELYVLLVQVLGAVSELILASLGKEIDSVLAFSPPKSTSTPESCMVVSFSHIVVKSRFRSSGAAKVVPIPHHKRILNTTYSPPHVKIRFVRYELLFFD